MAVLICSAAKVERTRAAKAPRFAESVLGNIVNWDFVERNLDGRGADRADQETEAEPAADLRETEAAT